MTDYIVQINAAGEWAWTRGDESKDINSGKAVDFLNSLLYGDTPLKSDRLALLAELGSIGHTPFTTVVVVDGKNTVEL